MEADNPAQSAQVTDAELWADLKEGNKEALERLFHRHYGNLYRYGMKLTGNSVVVEDHIQELFLKVWTRRANLGDVSGVITYLWTSLRRRLIDVKRKRSHRTKRHNQAANAKPMMFSAEELIVRGERRSQQSKALKEGFDQLSERRREVLYLKYYEGMSYQEICQIMGISYTTARNYVCKGLASLRAYAHRQQPPVILALTAGVMGLCYAGSLFLGSIC